MACERPRWVLLIFSLTVDLTKALVVPAHACSCRQLCRVRPAPIYMNLDADRDRAVVARGKLERSFLQPGTAIEATEQKRAVIAQPSGFGAKKAAPAKGASKGKKKASKARGKVPTRPLSALGAEMKANGVVRINNALSPDLVERLRDFCDKEREEVRAQVDAGTVDMKARFADLVLLDKRCDLLLPLHGPPLEAMHQLLGEGSVLGPLLHELVGDTGVLQELACLTSYPGSEQQPLHPDTPWTPIPSAYTAFIALQDIDEEMGPTVYLPGTQTEEAHNAFFGGDLSVAADNSGIRRPPPNEEFLRSRPVKLGLLKAGDLALYNQQTLHCGSANESPRTRHIFYISVKNPLSQPKACASIRPDLNNKLTMRDMRDELAALKAADTSSGDPNGGSGLFAKLDALDAARAREPSGSGVA